MPLLVLDPYVQRDLIRRRRRLGHDKQDEVWDGVYLIMPSPDDEHQAIRGRLSAILLVEASLPDGSLVRMGVNITDRPDAWKTNYRCPDVVVFSPRTRAVNHSDFWHGGADFTVEIRSRGDMSRKKLPFYGRVGTRELLIIDRRPWALELYRLDGEAMRSVGKVTEQGGELTSEVVPLRFALRPAEDRPRIVVTHASGQPVWEI